MNLDDYQAAAKQTAIYPDDAGLDYLIPALAGEAGEVASKWAKIIRDQGGAYDQADADALVAEVGDCLWMVAMLADELGVPLSDVAAQNLAKLEDRQQRGVLGGSGDDR